VAAVGTIELVATALFFAVLGLGALRRFLVGRPALAAEGS
jgi:hypothetical protein